MSVSNLKRVNLELGGKNPVIVMDDANLMKAAMTCHGAGFINSGQFCGQPSRLFVHEKVYDEFVGIIVDATKNTKMGYWREEDVRFGPQVDEEHLNKILSYVSAGVDEGATLVCGGKRIQRDGFFMEPAIFTNVHKNMKIAREEIFGPVLCIQKIGSLEEGIELANDTSYGLSSGIFSESMKNCHKFV